MKSRKTRSTRTYVLLELGELLLIVIILIVISRFIPIPLWIVIAIPAGKLLKFIVVYPFVRRSLRQPVYSGMESLIGRRGWTVETLDPEGYVNVRGELWRAISYVPIPAGVEVEVYELEGTKLVVKAVR